MQSGYAQHILAFEGKQRDPKAGHAKFEHCCVLRGQVCQND